MRDDLAKENECIGGGKKIVLRANKSSRCPGADGRKMIQRRSPLVEREKPMSGKGVGRKKLLEIFQIFRVSAP